jgi:hypothetical protein
MTAQPEITALPEGVQDVSTWSVTLMVRGSSRCMSPRCFDQLEFLKPTVATAAQPNRRIINLAVKATSAATAVEYGRRRTAQALTAAAPGWRLTAPGHAYRLELVPTARASTR